MCVHSYQCKKLKIGKICINGSERGKVRMNFELKIDPEKSGLEIMQTEGA